MKYNYYHVGYLGLRYHRRSEFLGREHWMRYWFVEFILGHFYVRPSVAYMVEDGKYRYEIQLILIDGRLLGDQTPNTAAPLTLIVGTDDSGKLFTTLTDVTDPQNLESVLKDRERFRSTFFGFRKHWHEVKDVDEPVLVRLQGDLIAELFSVDYTIKHRDRQLIDAIASFAAERGDPRALLLSYSTRGGCTNKQGDPSCDYLYLLLAAKGVSYGDYRALVEEELYDITDSWAEKFFNEGLDRIHLDYGEPPNLHHVRFYNARRLGDYTFVVKGGKFAVKHREHGLSRFDFKKDIVVRVTGPQLRPRNVRTDLLTKQEEKEKKGVGPLKRFMLRRKLNEAVQSVINAQGGGRA